MWLVVEMQETGEVVAVPLRPGVTVVGRSDRCDLVILDARVSGRHAELSWDGTSLSFRDLSGGGIEVDGALRREGIVAAGQTLDLGGPLLRASLEAPRPERRRASRVDGEAVTGLSAAVERLAAAPSPRAVLAALLDESIRWLSAERGYVLLQEHPDADPVSVAAHAIDDVATTVALSRTLVREALVSGRVLVVEDTSRHPAAASARSLTLIPSPRAVVCQPLLSDGRPFGAVYLVLPVGADAVDGVRLTALEALAAVAAGRVATQQARRSLLEARGRLDALTQLAGEGERFVLGEGPTGRALDEAVEAAAASETTVLVTGETGTGKEMVARALHRRSGRRDGPFVPVNCAALPRDLVEAELFGVERGAFTGAERQRKGRFELAAGGTLFLDEVGELPPEVQTKLLRVLQDRRVARLGGADEIPLDFRLVCATNRDLEGAVRDGAFRADLYYRINVFRIELLPLRERPEDVLLLARHFLAEFSRRFGKSLERFDDEAEAVLCSHDWPGNVRELRNAVERAAVVSRQAVVGASCLPVGARTAAEGTAPLTEGDQSVVFSEARDRFEQAFLERALARAEGNIAAVVRESGLGRPTVYRWLERFGLRAKE